MTATATAPARPATASDASDSIVFTPLQVGELTLQHRIVMAPLTRLRTHADHTLSELAVEYYAQRASYPGTLLVSEGTNIAAAAGGWPHVPGVYTAKHIQAWKKVVDAVHAQGSFLFLQICPIGRAASLEALRAEDPAFEVVGPSDEGFEGGAKPRALTVEEVGEYVGWMAEAARAFVEGAGGDGVEIHAANGYLIDQFTQTNSNKRTDKYGGSVENRCRFGLEIADAVVAAIGAEKTGIRFSPYCDYQGMKMPQPDIESTFTYFTRQLAARHPSLAYLHLVESRASGPEDTPHSPAESLDFLARAWAPRPLLVAGGHPPTLEGAERTLARYEGSAAVFGRYFVSNPDLVARIRWGVEARKYDRSTFYVPGPDGAEGYTTYPVEYGVEGRLEG